MTELPANRASTRVATIIRAPRQAVYRACLDPDTLAAWRVPDTMTGHVEVFEAREGGRYRMSLTYQDREHAPAGKTAGHTDTFQGRFVELVPDEKIVEVVEFDAPDPRFAGEMTITTRFSDTTSGTEVSIRCEDIPAGIRPEDNEVGTKQALQKLATLLVSMITGICQGADQGNLPAA
jgi:uncharacterized protein YndB with AHSA1/START domain